MINRLYINNFRCLVNFTAELESFGVLCGSNGSGKSSVLDALELIRTLATGDGVLGGDGERDVPGLEFTNWMDGGVQEFELGITVKGRFFKYTVHLEQTEVAEKPRFLREEASCDGEVLFERDLDGVRIRKHDGARTGFPLDWRQAALAVLRPKGSIVDLALLQEFLAKLTIVRPNPPGMERESRAEVRHPSRSMGNLTSWYRSLSQDYQWTAALIASLKEVWPDLLSLRLVDVGRNAKALQLLFNEARDGDGSLDFAQLSDGEKAIVGLHMIRAALETGAIRTVLIDEPDNYVGLPELQPWVHSLRELLDEEHQAVLISHHPEVLGNAGSGAGMHLWRDNHTSPTRIGPLNVPAGMSPGEALARGWIHA